MRDVAITIPADTLGAGTLVPEFVVTKPVDDYAILDFGEFRRGVTRKQSVRLVQALLSMFPNE